MDEKKAEALAGMVDMLLDNMTIEEAKTMLSIISDRVFVKICCAKDIDEFHVIKKMEVATDIVHSIEYELRDYIEYAD